MVDFAVFDFDDERVWEFHVLGGNHEIIGLRNQHFNVVCSISKIVYSSIKCFLFDYLISRKLIRLHLILPLRITSSFLVKGISNTSTFNFFLNNEIWLAVHTFFIDQRVFTDVLENVFSLNFFFLPS